MTSRDSPLFPSLDTPGRVLWIDHTRGFVLINTTIFWLLPIWLRRDHEFFMAHPRNSPVAHYINYHDIGLLAYVTIMGLMMARSYAQRATRTGPSQAMLHLLRRYGIILVMGLMLIAMEKGSFVERNSHGIVYAGGLPVIEWGVFASLGLVGLIAALGQRISARWRVLLALGFAITYQYMLLTSGWRQYAIASSHGGLLGSLCSLSALMLASTALGGYLFCNDEATQNQKLRRVLVLALLSGALAYALSFIPELYPNRRQMTCSYLLFGLSVTLIGALPFMALHKLRSRPIAILDGFGRNSLAVFSILLLIDLAEKREIYIPSDTARLVLIVGMFAFVALLDHFKVTIKL